MNCVERCSAYIFPALETFRSDFTYIACAIYVKSTMCSEKKSIYGINITVVVRMYITTRGKQVLRFILRASVNHVTVVRHNP